MKPLQACCCCWHKWRRKDDVGMEVMESSCDFIQLRIWMYWVIYAWDYALTVTIPSYFDDCRFDTFCFQGTHRYILDPYSRLTHVSSTPPPPLSGHPCAAKEHGWASWNSNQTVGYLVAKAGTGISSGRCAQAAKVHRLRWLRQFKGPFLCHRWWIPGVVLVILTVGFPQFWWIFLRSLG